MKNVKILVVDDSNVMREVVTSALKSISDLEVIVVQAFNGEEAETKLQEATLEGSPFDIVITDWMMPVMTGLQFLEKIRRVEAYKTLPVIMVSAETYDHQMARCLELGVFGYVTKPFSRDEVKDVVLKWIELKKDVA